MKPKPKRRPKGKQLENISSSPRADVRPIQIVGTLAGVVVAEDRTESTRTAERIRTSWTESGLSVVVT